MGMDELSRAIGRLEGVLEELKIQSQQHGDKLDKINTRLTNHQIKVAGISGSIAIVISLFTNELKRKVLGM